jgi:hypothetical protein
MFVAIAVIGVLAAGGAAFTAAIGGVPASTTAGFAKETINGATATNVAYALSQDGQYVDQVTVTLTGDYHTGYYLKGGLSAAGVTATPIDCTPTYSSPSTTAVCDFTAGAGPTHGVPVTGADQFVLSVTNSDGTIGYTGH